MAEIPSLVVHRSALVALVAGSPVAPRIAAALRGHVLHGLAGIDELAASAIARLAEGGRVDHRGVPEQLRAIAAAPIERHPAGPLLETAWAAADGTDLGDSLCLALARRLGCPVLTTDPSLAAAAPAATVLVTA